MKKLPNEIETSKEVFKKILEAFEELEKWMSDWGNQWHCNINRIYKCK